MDFIKTINHHVARHWKNAVHSAEEKYSKDDVGSRAHLLKVRDYAQMNLVRGLVEIKGGWLTTSELEYTLDLFHTVSSSVDYFAILELGEAGWAEEMRRYVAVEEAV